MVQNYGNIVDRTANNRARHAQRANWALISARECRLSAAAAVASLRSRSGVVADCVRLCRTRDRRRSFFLRLSSLLRVSSRICSMLLHFPSHRSDAVRHSSVDRSCRWLFLVLTGASAIFSLRLLLAADRYFSCPFPSPLRQFVDSTIVHQEPSYFLCLLFMLINVAITRQDLPEWSWVFILDRNKSYYLCTYLCVSLWKWSCITEVIRWNAISRLISSRITLESMIVRAKSSLVHFL